MLRMVHPPLRAYPIHPLLEDLPVSDNARRVASIIMNGVTWAGVHDLAAVAGCEDTDIIYPALKQLADAGFVEWVRLGRSRRLTNRWRLTPRFWEFLEEECPPQHSDWAHCRHLERLPVLENVYPAIARVEGLGAFRRIQWHEGLSLDASVRFEHGWTVVFYSGNLESEGHLKYRLGQLAQDLRDHQWGRTEPWPSLFLFVVQDHWQLELVQRTWGPILDPQLVYFVVSDETYMPAPNPQEGRGYLWQHPEIGDLGGWPLQQRLEDSPWNRPGGQLLARTLDEVIKAAGCWLSYLITATGENDRKRLQWTLKKLRSLGWIEMRLHKGKGRYSVTPRGYHQAARRDGVSNVGWHTRAHVPVFDGRPQRQDHEDGVLLWLLAALEAGYKAEPGWRSWENMGEGIGGIAPDGIVFLTRGPFGPGWHYMEYERSARGKRRAGRKLNGYISRHRQDDFPVLFVLWNENAERNFWVVGQPHGLRMLTTTITRLREFGAVGVEGCWSHYGESVVVGSPADTG